MAGKDDCTKTEPRVIVETYSEELSGLSRSPSMVLVHKFGERQNAYNRNIESRMQAIQSVCSRFQREIHELQRENDLLKVSLKAEKDRSRQLFEKMAHDMKKMQNVINEIRLYTDLNNKAIKRMCDESESEASDSDENAVKNDGNN